MTYDKVAYSFGVTMKNVTPSSAEGENDLEWALDELERLASREVTGNAAITLVETILENISKYDQEVIKKILDRDLKINMGRTNINKVIKGLITKPCYMRCDIGHKDLKLPNGKTKKSSFKNISYPAIVNLKADGTYREINKSSEVSFISRSGESYQYSTLAPQFMKMSRNGYLMGEMTVKCSQAVLDLIIPKIEKEDKKNDTNLAQEIKDKFKESEENNEEYILPRQIGNGLLNSDNVPEEDIIIDLWDYVSEEDYQLAGLKDKKNTPKMKYKERFQILRECIEEINHPRIRVIEHKEVQNLKEALQFTSEKMNAGLEGAILKDYSFVFKDGTQKQQLKLKLEIEADVRVTGFIEGTKGTKREETFGSLTFENDEGTIKGSTSGFSDDLLEEINNDRESWIGKIITVQFNDLSKARGHDYYALSHPRFVEVREDKDSTDTLERCLEMKEMAMNLEG